MKRQETDAIVNLHAQYFDIMKSELIEEQDDYIYPDPGAFPYKPKRRIPIVGRMSARLPSLAEEYIEAYIDIDLKGSGTYFGLRVSGDSMNGASINYGNVVIVRKQLEVENGQIAVVIVNGYDGTIKRYYRQGDMLHSCRNQQTRSISHKCTTPMKRKSS